MNIIIKILLIELLIILLTCLLGEYGSVSDKYNLWDIAKSALFIEVSLLIVTVAYYVCIA